jgi:hypothetical protein
MRKQIALGSVLALGFAGSVLAADGFSYDNLAVSYLSVNPKGAGSSISGFGISDSFTVKRNIFIFYDYDRVDRGNLKRDDLGVGFHWMLNPNLDLTSGLSLADVDTGPDATGYGLAAGLRGRVAKALELTGGVKYYHLNKGWKSQTTFTVGGRYHFTSKFSAGVDFSDLDDLGKGWRISLRYDNVD